MFTWHIYISRVSSSISPYSNPMEESRGNETRLQEELAAWSPGENMRKRRTWSEENWRNWFFKCEIGKLVTGLARNYF